MVNKSTEQLQTGLTTLCNNLNTEPSCVSEHINILFEPNSTDVPG